ncbi:MAG: acyltransferase [Gemmatimonadetes bacterium]|nr:MAG: acyltransferase [Gemmatimonadota bacterium]
MVPCPARPPPVSWPGPSQADRMWLLPALSLISNAAARVFYRFSVEGARVPAEGPVLLVANHPNSLFDPVLVAAAAGRPVRFLAKSTLFADPKVGWLMRSGGAIPVYRRQDAPGEMERNEDTFRAVFDELARGAAVGIFPEGISHSEPALAELRTGAARIALGSAAATGTAPVIVPVGMVPEDKARFRSRMRAVVGAPVEWGDLASRGPGDREAVRVLTQRIRDALRRVTLNLEAWEDRPLVEGVEEIWRATRAPGERRPSVDRLGLTTQVLADLRRVPDSSWHALVREVRGHLRRLGVLGLRPRDLRADAGGRRGLRRGLGRIYLVGLPMVAAAVLGWLSFYPPYRVTAWIVRRADPDLDRQSTYKLLLGIPIYGAWLALVAGGAGAAAAAAVGLPLLGLVGLWVREGWRGAWRDARRFVLLRSRGDLVAELAARQQVLADRLAELHAAWGEGRLSDEPREHGPG